ncbi:MAG: hypothetical protein JW936_07790 [Sedimentisphaerales bacterium]|nr:hypothetical protein [Sedimentisphaerales bacterium]
MADRTTTSLQVAQSGDSRNKYAWGCGVGCLAVVIVMVILAFLGLRMIWNTTNRYITQFEQQGFVRAEVIDGRFAEDATGPYLCVGQAITLTGAVHDDLAIVAQNAEIQGQVQGEVFFRGAILIISADAVIAGNLDVVAREVYVNGFLQGQVLGTFEQLFDHRRPWAEAPANIELTPEPPTPEASESNQEQTSASTSTAPPSASVLPDQTQPQEREKPLNRNSP